MADARSIVARDDTLLGICHALGEDFGFNPLYLRLAFALGILWSPATAFAAYAGLGALVAISRWIAPNPAPVSDEATDTLTASSEAPAERREELPLAA